MPEKRGKVAGTHDTHHVMFYGLSTCVWCKRTRKFLEEHNVAFEFVYVDLLEGEEKKAAKAQMCNFNPKESFPTLVIDGSPCVVGYKPEEIKKALGL
ncbi:MAG TPA: glutaredoxin family protein [Candidatus Heimdallarchaeota archaeon]|nr:glutaredoxin family protein [Candidatus Heimdallarchaeota archaeon]